MAGRALKPRARSCHHGRAMRRAVLVLLAVALALAAVAVDAAPGSRTRAGRRRADVRRPGRRRPRPRAVPTTASRPRPRRPARATTPALERAREMLATIQARGGEPLAGYVGGRAFQNRERRLPPGRYREYDVHPRVAGRDRGAGAARHRAGHRPRLLHRRPLPHLRAAELSGTRVSAPSPADGTSSPRRRPWVHLLVARRRTRRSPRRPPASWPAPSRAGGAARSAPS